jgi:thioredoxin reductase
VVGLGYVGLTMALSAATNGIKVIGIDSDKKKIESLKNKKSYISEPGIEDLLEKQETASKTLESRRINHQDMTSGPTYKNDTAFLTEESTRFVAKNTIFGFAPTFCGQFTNFHMVERSWLLRKHRLKVDHDR